MRNTATAFLHITFLKVAPSGKTTGSPENKEQIPASLSAMRNKPGHLNVMAQQGDE